MKNTSKKIDFNTVEGFYSMQTITNIMQMREIIHSDISYNKQEDLSRLELMSQDELWDLQISLIPDYNKAIERRNAQKQ